MYVAWCKHTFSYAVLRSRSTFIRTCTRSRRVRESSTKDGFVLSQTSLLSVFFYSARNCIASAVLATAIPSVCPSDTRRYCVKTTARSTMQFSPLDSKMCLVLYKPKNIPQGRPLPLKLWLKVTYPLLKAASFDTFYLVAPQP